MNPLRRLTHQECPRCGNVYSKDAKYCNRCNYGNKNGWSECTACGSDVGAESDFCWYCKADLTSQIRDRTRGGVWRRELGEIAVRITLQSCGRILEEGVQVADGTRGLLYVDSRHEKSLSEGLHEEKPLRTILDRFFALESKGKGRVEAILVPTDSFEVPVKIHHCLTLAGGASFQASIALAVKIVDVSKVYTRLLLGRDLVTVAELEGELLNDCTMALGKLLVGASEEFLFEKRYDLKFFENPLHDSLKITLSDLGLEFVRLKDISFIGEALDTALRRRIEGRLRTEGLEKRFEALQDEADFLKFKNELEHGKRLNDMEIREVELLFEVKMKERIREAERPGEMAEEVHRAEKAKIRAESIRNTLEVFHKHGIVVMRDLLDLEARKNELEIDQQIRLAQALDGLSPEAILASACKEVRVDLLAHAAASRGDRSALAIPEISSRLERRSGTDHHGARSVDPGMLKVKRKAVGLLYAASGSELLAQLGTVWALRKSLVVTNAHVATVAMRCVENGFDVWVRFPEGSPIQVSGMKIHPRFKEHVAKVEGKEHAIPGCDLAVLDLEGKSGYTLTCLSGDRLEVGTFVFYIGFPSEGLPNGGSNPAAPSPLYKPGTISNLTDFSYASVEPARAQLITFDAGIAGGASGSPLMNWRGDVVGVVSAGTMHAIKGVNEAYPDESYERIASGSLVNFAQRIDLLEELLD